jgi:DNA (cytosine-5)-methyltransferase 1
MKRTSKTVVAMRGRPKHGAWNQQLEIRDEGTVNTITSVIKDNLILGKVVRMSLMLVKEPTEDEKGAVNIIRECESDGEEGVQTADGKTLEDYLYTAKDGEQYGIFKLSPRECGRLMGVRDADISKMLAVNSNSQCYRQYGNSIVVPVLMAIFSQLHIKGVPAWNDLTEQERINLVEHTTIDWERVNG